MASPGAVDELWREQSLWSQTANRLKKRIDTARLAALVTVVVVAVFGAAAAALGERLDPLARVLAALAAVGSAALPALRPRWSGASLTDWTRVRSVSEALKSDVYLWLAGSGPFTDDQAAVLLRERGDALRRDVADLLTRRVGLTPVARDLPPVHDLHSYIAVRVHGQLRDYYSRRAGEIAARIRRFRGVEVGLAAAGAIIGAIAATAGVSLAVWIAVVATVGTAVSVHVSAARYEFQRIEFSRTAEELRQIADRATDSSLTLNDRLRLAERAEQVISIENQGWMAKLIEDPPDHVAPDDQAGSGGETSARP